MADRDNNPPYFPLSTQAQRIKEALQLDDERLWNALRRKVKAACYAMVNIFRGSQPDKELPTWTEFPNQLLQNARQQVLADDARDGAILSRPNGAAALDWLFGTAYNNMKREMARGRTKTVGEGRCSPLADAAPSPLAVNPQTANLGGIPDFQLPLSAGMGRGDIAGVSGINGQSGLTATQHFSHYPQRLPPPQHHGPLSAVHYTRSPNGQMDYGQQSNLPRTANGAPQNSDGDDNEIQEARDQDGQIYYYNTRTQASSWDRDDPGLRR
ncbi:hypothetical protein BJ508DRAFT_413015 [Ascobolus immersus RN42]|uniref:WW domain-containing protein n=1 Tax=Ascobolus immersus RN42 TaxID=1160509 RepID=A0A3N4IIH8_ASCIM|nr:hypothetical protein BJ508DRAFT_413015 [Ascobolus immersus RN42]